MKACKLYIAGDWAHFKRPETNNNPLSHDFITKTALIGLIGAVLGKTRDEMKELFPVLSQSLLYGVYTGIVKKESWSFTFRNKSNYIPSKDHKPSPGQMEILKNPKYEVFLALEDEKQEKLFTEFISFINEGKAIYNPVLGLHNCPVNQLKLLSQGEAIENNGEFETRGFVPLENNPEVATKIEAGQTYYRWGYEKLPTYQNNDWWNVPEKYRKVAYVADGYLKAKGKHYNFNNEQICLI